MKVRHVILAAGAFVTATLGLVAPAAAHGSRPAPSTYAKVLGPVVIDRQDPRVGYVFAIYRCTGVPELWVSVKQVEDRSKDPALAEEGSSGISAAWSDSHRNTPNCDSRTHIGRFTVDQQEPYFTASGPIGQKSDIYQPLARGWGYVQFCLFDDNYPSSGDEATAAPYSDMTFHWVL
jgi:hypothetical protein